MSFTDAVTGGGTWFAYSVESIPGGSGTPGVAVVPNLFLPVTDKKITPVFNQEQPKYMRGTRMTMATSERARLKISGTVDWRLNPSLGFEFYLAGLGAKANVSATAATATTASIATAGGVSVITVAGSYTLGAWVYVNTDNAGLPTANTEVRQIIAKGSGTISVGALKGNAAAVTGKFIIQPAQVKYANSILSSSDLDNLPTLTVEDDFGNFAMRYPETFVDSLSIGMGKSGMTVQAAIMGSADPTHQSSGVAYAPPGTDEANALRPLTSIDAWVSGYGDPDASGTSTLRALPNVTDIKIDFKNGLLEEEPFNGEHTFEVFPGDNTSCEVSITDILTSKRFDVFFDSIEASQGSSLAAGAYKNYGGAAAPNIGAVGHWIPFGKYTDQGATTKIGSINVSDKKFVALAPAGGQQDYLQVFVVTPT